MFHPQGPSFWELAVQALSSTEKGYDLLAPKFDFTPFRTPDPVLGRVAELVGPPGSLGSALDICCGTGAAMTFLRPLCRDRVVGLDVSRGMLEAAMRATAGSPGSARLEFVRGDARAMPFREEFDLATCFGAFGHILERDERLFVDQVYRALKPGGRFIFVTARSPRPWSLGFWLAHGFNLLMRLRNLLIRPPFVMYYLTFLLPRAQRLLEDRGFQVEVREGVLDPPFQRYALVVATRW